MNVFAGPSLKPYRETEIASQRNEIHTLERSARNIKGDIPETNVSEASTPRPHPIVLLLSMPVVHMFHFR